MGQGAGAGRTLHHRGHRCRDPLRPGTAGQRTLQPRISHWQQENEHAWGQAAVLGGLGGVSVYNGYFGAGSGILLIALLLFTAEPVL